MTPGKTDRPYPRVKAWLALGLMVLVGGMLGTGSAASAQPQVQALPSALRFISSLDLECFKTSPYTPPATAIVTRHINPVLTGLPVETVTLGLREQLCVPVAKNGVIPPADVLAFIKYVDLSCYRIGGIAVNRPLTLTHLNPLLSGIPPKNVTITAPQQLCVPVVKNGLFPPDEVRRLVSYIDLKCYGEVPPVPLNRGLTLSHLNPILGHLPSHNAVVTTNRQLCVPVQKNNLPFPIDVFNIVRYLDMEKYDLATPALITPVTLTLNHINPALVGLPTESATLTNATQIMLPVAKNGLIPPG